MFSDILTKNKQTKKGLFLTEHFVRSKNSWVKCIFGSAECPLPCNSLLLGQTAKNLILSFNMKKNPQNNLSIARKMAFLIWN